MTKARTTSPRLHLSQLMCRRIRSSMVIRTPTFNEETLIVCHEVTMWQAVTANRMVYLLSTEALTDAASKQSYEDAGSPLSSLRASRQRRRQAAARWRNFADRTERRSRNQAAPFSTNAPKPRRAARCVAGNGSRRQRDARARKDCGASAGPLRNVAACAVLERRLFRSIR